MEEEAASGGAESGEEEEEEARLRSAAAILSPRSELEPESPAPPPPPPPLPRPPPAASPGLAEQETGRPGGRGRSRAPSGSSSRSLRPRCGPHRYAQRLGRASASCWRPGEACRRGEGVGGGVGWGGVGARARVPHCAGHDTPRKLSYQSLKGNGLPGCELIDLAYRAGICGVCPRPKNIWG